MKKISLLIGIIFLSGILYADRIILRDNTVVSGKVIQVKTRSIEIDPDGEKAFDAIPREQVLKIVYDDGREVQITFDKVVFQSGKEIEGKIVEVNPNKIVYTPKGTDKRIDVPREKVQTLYFSDGKTVDLSEDQADEGERLPGFHKSYVRIAGAFVFGLPGGTVVNNERGLFEAYRQTLATQYGSRDYELNHAFVNMSCDLDLMLPAIEFSQSRGFDFTGIKFGLRGRYGFTRVFSSIYDAHHYDSRYYNTDLFSGRLMSYHFWAVGPTVNFIFSTRKNWFNLLINVYVLYGRIFNGYLNAGAALRDAGIPLQFQDYHTKFAGDTVRWGFGPHFALNKWFPVTVGMNVTYTYTRLRLNHYLPVYGGANTVRRMYEWGMEISLGVHL